MRRPKAEKTRSLLEWTTIPISYIYTGATVAILVLGTAGFFIYQALFGAQNKALKAIATATQLLEDATKVASPGEHDKLIAAAEKKLAEAQDSAGQKQWNIAYVAARESIRNSKEVLDSSEQRIAEKSVASFKRIQGSIEVKHANSTQWIQATQDTTLGPNDLVRSDAYSRAEIEYPNGTKVTVDPGSLIRILKPESSKQSSTSIGSGTLDVQTTKFRIGRKDTVQTPDGAEVSLGGDSRASIRSSQETRISDVSVAGGEASVKKGDETVKLGKSETVNITPDKGIGTVETLPDIPVMPMNLQIFEYEVGKTALATVRWEPVPGAVKYVVEMGQSPLLAGKNVERIEVIKTSFEAVNYPDGQYYWRVIAISENGKRSVPSTIQAFRIGKRGSIVAGNGEAVPIPTIAVTAVNPVGSNLILQGQTESGIALTVDGESVEVKSDGTFKSVTTLREDGENQVIVIAKNARGGVRRLRIIVMAQYS